MKKKSEAEQAFTKIATSRAATPETMTPPDKPVYMLKRIGSTTYKVAVHFRTDTKETAGDKIACLIRNETAVNQ